MATLARDLTVARLDPVRVRILPDGADRAEAAWAAIAGRLPTQVLHGDLAASNMLVNPATATATAVLDFKMADHWIRAIEPAAALTLTGAAHGPGWPRRAAAAARGGTWANG